MGKNMKKKLVLLLGAMIILVAVGALLTILTNHNNNINKQGKAVDLKIATTFYPIYMIGLNLANGSENIEVKSLTQINTGCIEDYQLTTEDLRIISDADVLVVNGGGMEKFLDDIKTNYPELKIIDASKGISLLQNSGNGELLTEADNESLLTEEDRGLYNPHMWLNPSLYMKQVENVKNGLIEVINSGVTDNNQLIQTINQNATAYIASIQKVGNEFDKLASKSSIADQATEGNKAIIFHDSFAYLADRIGLQVAFTVPLDADTALSAGDIAKIIDEVRKDKIKYLITEEQFSDSIAKQIASETGAKVYIIDTVVTGDGSKDSYEKAMQKNIKVLEAAMKVE
jgi:zinc transport system substrate-binding protein